MAESDVHEKLAGQEQNARAVFEPHLRPGEILIWADRADPKRLARHYIWTPLLIGAAVFATAFMFYTLSTTGGFARAIPFILVLFITVGGLFIGTIVFIFTAIFRQAWRILYLNTHYYGLTDRRLLRSIGGGRPRSFKREKIDRVGVDGPKDDEAFGDIQFYRSTGDDLQTYLRFFGIRQARKVAALIKAHLQRQV